MVGVSGRLRVHTFTHGCWAAFGAAAGFRRSRPCCSSRTPPLSLLFFREENFCLPRPDGRGRTASAFVCTFSLWWFATREHVEIINFKLCQTHFPHARAPQPPTAFTLPSETLALLVPKKPDNPVLLSRNQKSPCGFVTVGTRATLLQISKKLCSLNSFVQRKKRKWRFEDLGSSVGRIPSPSFLHLRVERKKKPA